MTELNEDLPGESGVRETELPAGKGPGRRQTAKFLIAGMLIGAAVMGIAGLLLWRFSKEQVIRNYIRKEAITEATDAEIEEGNTTLRTNPRRSTVRPYKMVNTAAMTMHGAMTNT